MQTKTELFAIASLVLLIAFLLFATVHALTNGSNRYECTQIESAEVCSVLLTPEG